MTILELLELLGAWENLDHDVGPDYVLVEGWLKLFADGSGSVIGQLNRRATTGNQQVDSLFTSIGLDSIQRQFTFNSVEQLTEILSKPIQLDYSR